MTQLWVSSGTLVAIALGVVISVVYVRYMWLALQRAVATRDDADVGEDRYRFGLVGAVIAVVGSAAAISAFGAAPALLYVGPALALLSAVVVCYCLRTEYSDD